MGTWSWLSDEDGLVLLPPFELLSQPAEDGAMQAGTVLETPQIMHPTRARLFLSPRLLYNSTLDNLVINLLKAGLGVPRADRVQISLAVLHDGHRCLPWRIPAHGTRLVGVFSGIGPTCISFSITTGR